MRHNAWGEARRGMIPGGKRDSENDTCGGRGRWGMIPGVSRAGEGSAKLFLLLD
jgi:hypothetical protein